MYELARMQIMAFFYAITFNQETKKGGFWLGDFFPLLEAHYSDWGNDIHKMFTCLKMRIYFFRGMMTNPL